MKSNSIYGLLLATVFIVSSCDTESINASDTIASREFSFSGYEALQLSGDFNAFVQFSDTEERIEIQANDNIQDRIRISQEGSTLRIGLENNVTVRGNVTLNVFITTSNISRYRLTEDSSVELQNLLATETITLEALGDSSFFGEVNTSNFIVELSGDSSMDVFGTANNLNARLNGDSTLRDFDLDVEDLIIDLSGDSDAFLTVENTIDLEASGDSALNFSGGATIIRQRLTGDSRINRRD